MTDAEAIPVLGAARALEYVRHGDVVGLGTGHAAVSFLHALSERLRAGLSVRGIPTSRAIADLAVRLGIPLTTLDEVEAIDVGVDGADEVDPRLNLIKGHGGALVRERIVAAACRRYIIVVGADKLVPTLGAHGLLPVEVVPFALAPCRRGLDRLGLRPQPRLVEGQLFETDNNNYILDCRINTLDDPAGVDRSIRELPGVVGTGLFLGLAPTVVVQRGDVVEILQP